MSSTEPPSRNAPRNQPQDTKSARDELSSKGKVEKVREIDADEQTRKRKFLKFYKDDQLEDENFEAENRPSPFDLISGKTQTTQDSSSGGLFGSSSPPSFSDEENNIIPSPPYTPPPSVNSMGAEEEGAATEEALPQSEGFWGEFELPDQPTTPASFQQTPGLVNTAGFAPPPQQGESSAGAPGTTPVKAAGSKGMGVKGEKKGPTIGAPAPKGEMIRSNADGKKGASPFGPPGKPTARGDIEAQNKKMSQDEKNRQSTAPKLPSPFDSNAKISDRAPYSKDLSSSFQKQSYSRQEQPKIRPVEKGEETNESSLSESQRTDQSATKEDRKDEDDLTQGPASLLLKPEDQEGNKGGDREDRDQKVVEIESSSLPTLPSDVQPMAMTATTQAAPYLNPTTASLFFQMVGTMYVMSGPQGISRTEIVLNNPAYANSKFFGSTITIEKYATAPDSFNIRLTGSQEAVATFKENIPSLMTAFQNGKFAFKVNRLDVDYTIEKPIFRRKEKGEDKGEAGGGDLGERRK